MRWTKPVRLSRTFYRSPSPGLRCVSELCERSIRDA